MNEKERTNGNMCTHREAWGHGNMNNTERHGHLQTLFPTEPPLALYME